MGRSKPRPPTFAEQTAAIDDPRGAMGIRLVSQRKGDRARIGGQNAALVAPIEAGVVDVVLAAQKHRVDRSSWMLVPPEVMAAIVAASPVAHTIVLTMTRPLLERVASTYAGEIDGARYARYLRTPELLPRTTWVNELCHRYLFERAVCKKRDNDATRFLETELGKEVYFLCHERQAKHERASVLDDRSELVRRALKYLEEHLFDEDVLRALPKACAASPSTLLRAFKREVGEAPLAYVRTRRLDEALLLLKTRRHGVGEVAMQVGYKNLAAFSQAFRERFGMRPSDVTASRTRASAPPAGIV